MNKDLLICRAKTLSGGTVYGYPNLMDNTMVCDVNGKPEVFEIDIETLSRPVGAKDANGEYLFEGDEVKYYKRSGAMAWNENGCGFSFVYKSRFGFFTYKCIAEFDEPEIDFFPKVKLIKK